MTERAPAHQPLLFALRCGIATVSGVVLARLTQEGLIYDPEAELVLVLDTPRGFAPAVLATMEPRRRSVVVTWSFCPEYLDDLWDAGPAVLLVGDGLTLDMAQALEVAARGERQRITNVPPSTLTPMERRVLRLLARGLSNEQIAAHLQIQTRTVKNATTLLYTKIGASNRSAAILYYWGIWQG